MCDVQCHALQSHSARQCVGQNAHDEVQEDDNGRLESAAASPRMSPRPPRAHTSERRSPSSQSPRGAARRGAAAAHHHKCEEEERREDGRHEQHALRAPRGEGVSGAHCSGAADSPGSRSCLESMTQV